MRERWKEVGGEVKRGGEREVEREMERDQALGYHCQRARLESYRFFLKIRHFIAGLVSLLVDHVSSRLVLTMCVSLRMINYQIMDAFHSGVRMQPQLENFHNASTTHSLVRDSGMILCEDT